MIYMADNSEMISLNKHLLIWTLERCAKKLTTVYSLNTVKNMYLQMLNFFSELVGSERIILAQGNFANSQKEHFLG